MSAEKPTDTDHEVLKLLRWIRQNFNVDTSTKEFRWVAVQDGKKWSYCSEEFILDQFKVTQKKEDAKH